MNNIRNKPDNIYKKNSGREQASNDETVYSRSVKKCRIYVYGARGSFSMTYLT